MAAVPHEAQNLADETNTNKTTINKMISIIVNTLKKKGRGSMRIVGEPITYRGKGHHKLFRGSGGSETCKGKGDGAEALQAEGKTILYRSF